MQVVSDKVEDFLIPQPRRRLLVQFSWCRFERDGATSIKQSSNIDIRAFPAIRDDRNSTRRNKTLWNIVFVQCSGIRLPRQRFGWVCLAQTFQEPHAAAIGVEAINVVKDKRTVPELPCLHVYAERRSCTADPARVCGHSTLQNPAFADSSRAKDNQQVEISPTECRDVSHQDWRKCEPAEWIPADFWTRPFRIPLSMMVGSKAALSCWT